MELDIKPKLTESESSDDKEFSTINLYRTPPYGTLTLEECEDLFRQRLEALIFIEKADMGNDNFGLISKPLREIKSYVYKSNCILLKRGDRQLQRLDHFAHMLTRMYCIYHPDIWSWFKSTETKLLYYRLRDQVQSISGNQLEAILRSFKFNFARVRGQEIDQLIEENLIGWKTRDVSREQRELFKVKFTDALKFVSKRSVPLKDGYAYLSKYEIITVLCDIFNSHLDQELIYARQHFSTELLQTRQLLDSLENVYSEFCEKVEEDKRKNRQEQGQSNNPYCIDIKVIDEVAKDHFPPCMRYIHQSLRDDHHMKHMGRLIYGAFLRSGGVAVDDAVEFYRQEFTKKIPNDRFEREYKYNIRHIYGREGHKKALTSFSCDKIIAESPGPMEKHGCPFKHFDEAHLRSMLSKHGLKEVDIESVLMYNRDKEHKLACSHYYKFLKGELPPEPIKNPMQFYYNSVRLSRRPADDQGEGENVKKEDDNVKKEDEIDMED